MKLMKGKITRIITGCMAAVITLCSTDLTQIGNAYSPFSEGIKPVESINNTFKDPKFRQYVKDAFDSDKNGKLDPDEILYARNIHIEGKGVEDLTGIETLVELRGLYCSKNNIKKIDLSNNTLVTGLWCDNNPLEGLNLYPNRENMEWIYCYNCGLTSLDVSSLSKLSYLECNSNSLKTLDVSHNQELEHLMCGDCELTELNLTKNPKIQHLDAFRNDFTKDSLKISNCNLMKRLDIWDNPRLGSVDVSIYKGLQFYNCAYNNVKDGEIDLSNNPELTKLSIAYNRELTEIDVSHNTKLAYFDCCDCKLQNLDVSNNPNLRFLQAFINEFTSLNIGNNPYLLKTYNKGDYDPNVNDWDIASSWKIDYGGDTSTGGGAKDNILFLCFDYEVNLTMNGNGKLPEIKEPVITDTFGLMKREEVVQMLYELAGKPSVSGLKSRFTDVKPGASYYNALLWGENISMCMGYPYFMDDTFGVGKYINRQDVLFMLMRFSEYMHYERSIDFGRSDEYSDYYEIDFDHWEAVCWACTWHITEGTGDPTADKSERKIDPYKKVTLSEFSYMYNNMMDLNHKPDHDFHASLLGDINRDGVITADDAVITARYAADYGLIRKLYDGKYADINCDGKVSTDDAVIIARYAANYGSVRKSYSKYI